MGLQSMPMRGDLSDRLPAAYRTEYSQGHNLIFPCILLSCLTRKPVAARTLNARLARWPERLTLESLLLRQGD